MFWSEDGSLVAITTSDGFYVLSVREEEDGFVFELLHELGDVVLSGCWFGSCFLYNTEKSVKYYVGGELIVVKHLSKRVHLLGYLEKENAIIVVDKDVPFLARFERRKPSPPFRSTSIFSATRPPCSRRTSRRPTRSSPTSAHASWRSSRYSCRDRDICRRPFA